MRPATIVHVLGNDAAHCYNAIKNQYSIYVIGRGSIPGGYFLVTSKPDYPTLRTALTPWIEIPTQFPAHQWGKERLARSQEMWDVTNYIARPPQPDQRILGEARKRLRGLIPKKHLGVTAQACQWLRENMSPANNCYTLAALLARWLVEHGAHAKYCTGQATLRRTGQPPVTIPHAWVDLGDEVCDLTVDQQDAWGDLGRPVARIRVNDPRIKYQPDDEMKDLDRYWALFSKPPDRPPYTAASLERQSGMIREMLGPLFDEREPWVTRVREHGILEGTYRLIEEVFGEASQ